MNTSSPALRESLGLPSLATGRRGVMRLLSMAAIVSLLAGVAGYGGGRLYHRVRLSRFAETARSARRTWDVPAFRGYLLAMEQQRAALTQNATARTLMAETYLLAADRLPEQAIYYEAALGELREATRMLSADATRAEQEWMIQNARLQALLELGRWGEAKAAADRVAQGIARVSDPKQRAWMQRSHINTRAYLLALADDPAVRDPQAALALIRDLMKSDTPDFDGRFPTAVAAYLDTLAEAYYAAGRPAEAVTVQRTVLGLAQPTSLGVYLQHYDRYAAAAQKGR